jgi:DNA-binding NarL/FixJ family response regulator
MFLPAYSPEFNLIELGWHSCNEFVAHRLFQSVEQLKELLKRLLNDGELVIYWKKKFGIKEIVLLQIRCLLAYILQSLQMGALGYLLKRTPAQEIAAAIRSVSQGYSQLGPTIALKVFSQLKSSPPSPNSYQDLLSQREIGVLKLVGQGKNNQEIAQELHLSEGTVKNYVTQILNKLEMRDRIQAALWAQQNLL